MVPPGEVQEESGISLAHSVVDSIDSTNDLWDVFWSHGNQIQKLHDLTLIMHDALRG